MKIEALPVTTGSIEDYLTPQSAAQLKDVQTSSVYDAVHAGRLTPYSVFGQTVLKKTDVEAWTVRAKNGSRSQH